METFEASLRTVSTQLLSAFATGDGVFAAAGGNAAAARAAGFSCKKVWNSATASRRTWAMTMCGLLIVPHHLVLNLRRRAQYSTASAWFDFIALINVRTS
jgi:hypothetical protein